MKKLFLTLLLAGSALLLQAADLYRALPTGNHWKLSGENAKLETTSEGFRLTLMPESANTKVRILLDTPVDAGEADTLQFYYNMPFLFGPDYANDISLIVQDSSGKEKVIGAGRTLNTHFAPANSRLTAYWKFGRTGLKKGMKVLGFQVFYNHWNKQKKAKQTDLYFRDIALTKTDFGKAKLYYSLSNFKGNFNNPGFNGCSGRFLSENTSQMNVPFIFLDNAVDFVMFERPAAFNLRFDLFDENDKLIWSEEHKNVSARNAWEWSRKFPIPVTKEGTYRLRAKSSDARNSKPFMESWVRLVIIRGDGKLPSAPLPERLAINPETPWGVLKKDQKLVFAVGKLSGNGKWSLRYGYKPFSMAAPGYYVRGKYTVTETIPLDAKGNVRVERPFVCTDDLTTVIAELCFNGSPVERAERDMGVSNRLDKAPAKTIKIPTIREVRAKNGGIWENLQIHAIPADPLGYFKQNLPEYAKVCPSVGFSVGLDFLEPLPGVFRWKYLTKMLDESVKNHTTAVLYLSQKAPPYWAPVRFFISPKNQAHDVHIVWKYLEGGYNYATGKGAPEIIRDFNTQLARAFRNHPGLGGYYFENEHLVSDGSSDALSSSLDEGNLNCFREYLKKKYQTVDKLNAAWKSSYKDFSEITMPMGKDVPPRRLYDRYHYIMESPCKFIRECQVDPVRAEDPDRPVLVYAPAMLLTVDASFYEHMAKNQVMLANGGIHSYLDFMLFREAYLAVPGLYERMEPHDMFSYSPGKFGLDDMIFGALGVGGRGLQFHYFIRAVPWQKFNADSYINARNPYQNGFKILKQHMPAIKELAQAEILHDPVGIVELKRGDQIGLKLSTWIRGLMGGLHLAHHYRPKARLIGGKLDWVKDCRILFVCGNILDPEEEKFLTEFVRSGGVVVLESNAAVLTEDALEKPSSKWLSRNKFQTVLQGPALPCRCDVFSLGKGKLIRIRQGISWWNRDLIPGLMKFAGVTNRLYNTTDSFLQVNPLRVKDTVYLACAHRGNDSRSAINGPRSVKNVQLQYFGGKPAQKYEVQDIWTAGAKPVTMTGEQLAKGFSIGDFSDAQMKIFRIRKR